MRHHRRPFQAVPARHSVVDRASLFILNFLIFIHFSTPFIVFSFLFSSSFFFFPTLGSIYRSTDLASLMGDYITAASAPAASFRRNGGYIRNSFTLMAPAPLFGLGMDGFNNTDISRHGRHRRASKSGAASPIDRLTPSRYARHFHMDKRFLASWHTARVFWRFAFFFLPSPLFSSWTCGKDQKARSCYTCVGFDFGWSELSSQGAFLLSPFFIFTAHAHYLPPTT